MRPQPRARMPFHAACVHRKTDLRLVAIVKSKSASVISSMEWRIATPALLTRMSIGPSAFSTLATMAATAFASETSAPKAPALRPSPVTAAAVASASALRSR